MGKEQAKHLLQELCNAALNEIPENCIFIEDGPMRWFSFSSDADPDDCMGKRTGAMLLSEMRTCLDAAMGRNYKSWIKIISDQKIFVFCLDEPDSEKVRIAKSVTRRARDNSRKKTLQNQIKKAKEAGKTPRPLWKWDGVSPIITLENPLPHWEHVNMDRAARERATDEFVELVKEHWSVDVGWTLIFDGHREGAKFKIFKTGNGIRQLVEFDELDLEVSHELGEADQKMAWYANKYWNLPACIISGDTDQLSIQLLNLVNTRLLPHLTEVRDGELEIKDATPLYVWAGNRTIEKSSGKTAKAPKQRLTQEEKDVETVQFVMDMKKLYVAVSDLFSDEQHKHIKYPLSNAVAAICTSGNDFVNGWYCVTMEKILYGLLENKEFVGDIFKGDALFEYRGNGRIYATAEQIRKSRDRLWKPEKIHESMELDVQAFRRLIAIGYYKAYQARKNSWFAGFQPSDWQDMDTLWGKIEEGVKRCNPKRVAAHVPPLPAISQNGARCWWSMIYSLFGSRDMEMIPHPLQGWGWVKQVGVLQYTVDEVTGELVPQLDAARNPIFKTEYYYKESFDGDSGDTQMYSTQAFTAPPGTAATANNPSSRVKKVHIVSQSSGKTSASVTTVSGPWIQKSRQEKRDAHRIRSGSFTIRMPIGKKTQQLKQLRPCPPLRKKT